MHSLFLALFFDGSADCLSRKLFRAPSNHDLYGTQKNYSSFSLVPHSLLQRARAYEYLIDYYSIATKQLFRF